MHNSTIESLPDTKTVHLGVKLRKVKNNHQELENEQVSEFTLVWETFEF